ncbi:MAG: VWA domain-containing protein [Acidobacteriota bacterium]
MRRLFVVIFGVTFGMCLTAGAVLLAESLHRGDGAPLQASSTGKAGQPISMPVSVRDASGNPIPNLKKQDFTLADNQHAQAITGFNEVSGGALGATAHAVVVVDAINDTSSGALNKQVKDIETFFSAGANRLPFPLTIAVLSNTGFMETDPSRDPSNLGHQLQNLTSGVRAVDCATDSSANNADDAAQAPTVTETMGQSLDHMEGVEGSGTEACRQRHLKASLSALRRVANEQASLAGRAVIVWVGPGWILGSDRGKQADWFAQVVRITDALRDAQATLDFVSTADFERAKEFRHVNWNSGEPVAASAKKLSPASLTLPVIARQSGGLVFNKSKDLAQDIGACLSGADHYYMLQFAPSPAPAKNELHSLSLTVNHPGAAVSAPVFYYGEQ